MQRAVAQMLGPAPRPVNELKFDIDSLLLEESEFNRGGGHEI